MKGITMKYWKAALMIAALTGAVQAEIIYQDTFSTDGSLARRAVEVGNGKWIAYSGLTTANGVALPGATVQGKNALLPFSPKPGMVYTLSADIYVTGGSNFTALGFCADANTPTGYELFMQYIDSPAPWAYVQANGIVATLTGPSGKGFQAAKGLGTSGTLKIVLDTTGDDWVATWFFNGQVLRTNKFLGDLTINYVGFGAAVMDTTVDNFKLEAVSASNEGLDVVGAL
jgi:hypothetical protein